VPSQDKIEEVKKLKELLENNNVHIVTDHSGFTVEEVSNFRRELSETGASMKVAKNRLIKIARDQAGLCDIEESLNGPSNLIMAIDDPISPAKVIKKYIDDIEKPTVKALVINDVLMDLSKFDEIASLPGIDGLRAKLVGGMVAPINGFVFSLSGIIKSLVYVLNAVSEQKE